MDVGGGGGGGAGGLIKPDLCHGAFVDAGEAGGRGYMGWRGGGGVGGVGGGIVCCVRVFIGLSSSFLCVSILLRDYVL